MKIENNQIHQMQYEYFNLPWKKMNSTINKTLYTCSIELLFIRHKKIPKKVVKLGSFLNVQYIYF